jgi:hypothetical protein
MLLFMIEMFKFENIKSLFYSFYFQIYFRFHLIIHVKDII